MTTVTDAERPSAVCLRVRGPVGEDTLTTLRQQLAACLCSGVTHLGVQLDEPAAGDVRVQSALQGADAYLRRRGGGLTVAPSLQEQRA